MRDFRSLNVWQKAHALTLQVYEATGSFPREEVYSLTSQLRRSASSIGANIAEGCGRSGDAELGRFLHIAMGSASELEYHLILARDLRYLTDGQYEEMSAALVEVKRMLGGLSGRLRPQRRSTSEDADS
jgi:four helix bundle protein